MFPAVGMPEMLLILLVALLVFGSKRLPELARILGKSVREFRKAAEQIRRDIDWSDHNKH